MILAAKPQTSHPDPAERCIRIRVDRAAGRSYEASIGGCLDGVSRLRAVVGRPNAPSPVANRRGTLSSNVRSSLQVILDFMQKYSINTTRIDWDKLRDTVISNAGDAQSLPQAYQAVETALAALDDFESYFSDPIEGRWVRPPWGPALDQPPRRVRFPSRSGMYG